MKNQSLILILSFSALTGSLSANAVETNLSKGEVHQKDQKFKQQWEENRLKKEALENELRLLLQEPEKENTIQSPSYPNPQVTNGGRTMGSWGWGMPSPLSPHDDHQLEALNGDEEDEELRLAIEASANDQIEEAKRLSLINDEKDEEENSRIHEYFSFVAKIPLPSAKEDEEEIFFQGEPKAMEMEEEIPPLLLNAYEEEMKEEKAEQQPDSLGIKDEDIVRTGKEKKARLIKTILDDLHPKIKGLWGQWRNKSEELLRAEDERYSFTYGSEERNKVEKKCEDIRKEKDHLYLALSDAMSRQESKVDKYFSFVSEKSSNSKDEQRQERKKALAKNLHEVRSEVETLQENVRLSSIQDRLAWGRYYSGNLKKVENTYEFLLELPENRPLAKGEIYLEKEGNELKYKVITPDQQRYTLLLSESEEPEENNVHLKLNNGILEYAVMTPHEGPVKETLDKKNTYEDLIPQGLTPQILKAIEPQIVEEMFNRGHIQGTIIEEALDMEIEYDLTLENLTDDVKRQILEKMFTRGHIQDLSKTWYELSNKKDNLQSQLNEALEKENHRIADYFTFVRDGTMPAT